MMTASDIKIIRKALRLSQQDLAMKLGVNIVTISSWETGKTTPANRLIRKKLESMLKKSQAGL